MIFKKLKYPIVILLFFVFVLSTYDLYCQDTTISAKQHLKIKNPEGTDFWLAFEKNYKDPKSNPTAAEVLQLELFITCDEDARITIEIDGIGYKQSFFVPGGTIKNVKLPEQAQVKSEEVIERLAVHITSDKPIEVFGLNRRFQTTDTFLGLPTVVLGTEYRAMCYTVSEGLMPQFAIVATENNTEVVIFPSVNTTKHPAKIPYKINLKQGDVYQVTAQYNSFSNCDLTGSLIKSNKKIAVFSGHQCAYVTPKIIACNHLVEQMPPVPSWGKHFYIGKLQPRSKYTFRVLANEPQTRIFIDAKLVTTLSEGEFFDSTINKNIQITANKPILVAQYSQGFKNGDSIGDPMMLLISPTQQFLQNYRFATPINGQWKHFINVVAPTKGITSIKLDGVPVDSTGFIQLGFSRYSISYIQIPFGSHYIEGDMPFGLYAYGFGIGHDAFDAYGNMVGQSFMDYEPALDTLPPTVEARPYIQNKFTLIFRDDRVDDVGIKDMKIIDNTGLLYTFQKIEEGMPSLPMQISPAVDGLMGRMVIQVTDMAKNSTIITVCYALDGKTEQYTFTVTDGNVRNCMPDPGIQIGIFGKVSTTLHSADFSSSGNMKVPGNFADATGLSGYAGLYIGRRLDENFVASGRLSVENYGGQLIAPDTITSYYRTRTGDLKPFQEGRILSLKGLALNLAFAGEYYPQNYFYLTGGLNFAFTMSKAISLKRTILTPATFTYTNGSNQIDDPGAPTDLNTINSLKIGVFGGVGFNLPINNRYSAFAEGIFNHFFTNEISDGNWTINQLSIQVGIKTRF